MQRRDSNSAGGEAMQRRICEGVCSRTREKNERKECVGLENSSRRAPSDDIALRTCVFTK